MTHLSPLFKTAILTTGILAIGGIAATPSYAEQGPAAAVSKAPAEADSLAKHTTEADPLLKKHSFNAVTPFDMSLGFFAGYYEYLKDGHHGLIFQAEYNRPFWGGTDFLAGSLGYRYHWSGSQDSGFIGANIRYGAGGTEGRTQSGEKFDIDFSSLVMTANIGRRWAWDSGFNVTLRFGGGRADVNVSTESQSEEAQRSVRATKALLAILPIAIDSELTVGWIF